MQQIQKCKAVPLLGEAVVQEKDSHVLEDSTIPLHLHSDHPAETRGTF